MCVGGLRVVGTRQRWSRGLRIQSRQLILRENQMIYLTELIDIDALEQRNPADSTPFSSWLLPTLPSQRRYLWAKWYAVASLRQRTAAEELPHREFYEDGHQLVKA